MPSSRTTPAWPWSFLPRTDARAFLPQCSSIGLSCNLWICGPQLSLAYLHARRLVAPRPRRALRNGGFSTEIEASSAAPAKGVRPEALACDLRRRWRLHEQGPDFVRCPPLPNVPAKIAGFHLSQRLTCRCSSPPTFWAPFVRSRRSARGGRSNSRPAARRVRGSLAALATPLE